MTTLFRQLLRCSLILCVLLSIVSIIDSWWLQVGTKSRVSSLQLFLWQKKATDEPSSNGKMQGVPIDHYNRRVTGHGERDSRHSHRKQPYKKSKYHPTKRLLRTASEMNQLEWRRSSTPRQQPQKQTLPLIPNQQLLQSRGAFDALIQFVRSCPKASVFGSSTATTSNDCVAAPSPEQQLSEALTPNAEVDHHGDIILSLMQQIVIKGADHSMTSIAPRQVRSYNKLIKEVSEKGYFGSCSRILHLMKSINIPPDAVTYSTLITRSGMWNQPALAEGYYMQMRRDQLPMNCRIMTAMMQVYAKVGDAEKTLEYFQKVIDYSEVEYKQQSKSVGRRKAKGSYSLVNDCNFVLKHLGDRGMLDDCAVFFSMMKMGGIEPDIITFNTLIARCATWKKVSMAEEYFIQLLQHQLLPDVIIFNSLMNAYSKCGDYNSALQLLKDMEMRRLPQFVYRNITASAAKSSASMLPAIPARIDTMNTLLASCIQQGDVVNAESIIEMIKERNLIPDYQTYSTMIHIYCQAANIEKAFQILKQMQIENIRPTAVTYSTILHGLGKCGRVDDAFKVLDLMKKKKIRPNVVAMSSLIDACGRFDRLEQAFTIFNEMQHDPNPANRPNSITCSALVDACLKQKLVDRAFGVVQYMREHRLALTEVTYTSLIAELTKLRQLHRIVEMVLSEPDEDVAMNTRLTSNPTSQSKLFPYSAKTLNMADPRQIRDASSHEAYQSLTTSAVPATVVTADSSFDTRSIQQMKSNMPALSDKTANDLLLLRNAVRDVCEVTRILDEQVSKKQESEISNALFIQLATGANSAQLIFSQSDTVCENIQREFSMTKGQRDFQPYKDAIQMLQDGKTVAKRLINTYRIIERYRSNHDNSNDDDEVSSSSHEVVEEKLIKKMTTFKQQQKHGEVLSVYNELEESGVNHSAQAYSVLMDSIYESAAAVGVSSAPAVDDNHRQDEEEDLDSTLRDARTITEEKERKLLISLRQIETRSDHEHDKQMHRQNQLFRLYLVFQEMKAKGIEADTAVYNSLINACAGAGELSKAMETLESMQMDGVQPDVITYTNLIKACVIAAANSTRFIENNPQQRELTPVQIAEDVFEAMQQKNNHFSTYVPPNRGTYSQLIRVHWRTIKEIAANALLNKYKNAEESSLRSGSSNNSAAEQDQEQISVSYHRIWQLYEELVDRGLSPSFMTYKTTMRASALVGGRLGMERCLKILQDIKDDPYMDRDSRCWVIALGAVRKEILQINNKTSSDQGIAAEERKQLVGISQTLMQELDELSLERAFSEAADPWDRYLGV